MQNWLIFIVLPLVTSFIVTFFAIPKIIYFSKVSRLFAHAGDRNSHVGKIPIFGGIAIYVGILFSLLLWGFNYEIIQSNSSLDKFHGLPSILISLSIVFLIGIIDDLLSLSPIKKLIGQIISILIIIFLGDLIINNMQGVFGVFELPTIQFLFFEKNLSLPWAGILFTIFVVVVITNAYNLIDGIDGLAGGLGLISASMFGVIFMFNNDLGFTLLAFCLVGSLLAFLKYNFNPASIFMGDTGSLVIGLILSILAIRLINTGVALPPNVYPFKGPFISIVILSIPLFDTFRVFFIRSLSGYNPLMADRNHIHHALLDIGFGHKKSSVILYVFSLIIAAFSYFLIGLKSSLAIFILAVVVLSFMSIPFILLRIRLRE